MKYKEKEIDDIIVIENCNLNIFSNTLKKIFNEYDVVDIQYSTNYKDSLKTPNASLHNAIILVKEIKK